MAVQWLGKNLAYSTVLLPLVQETGRDWWNPTESGGPSGLPVAAGSVVFLSCCIMAGR